MITPTFQTMSRNVRAFTEIGAGVPVFVGNTDRPLTEENVFGVLTLVRSVPDGYPWSRGSEPVYTYESMTLQYQAQFYRVGAHDAASQLRLWAMSQHGVTNAKQLGFSAIRFRDIVNISDIIYDSWEERTSITFSIGVVRILSVDSEYYDSLCIDILQGTTEVPTIILEVE